jgi:hypothetical protein
MAVGKFVIARSAIQAVIGRACLLCALLALPVASCFAGTTYRWVDEQGQVHYADTPPAGRAYETVAEPPHPAATPPSVTSPSVNPSGATAEPVRDPDGQRVVAPASKPTADDARCVDALYQIALLNEKRRAFKPGPGGTRVYIDDADRPAELERLGRERDENCSSDAATRKSQDLRADELMQGLSPDCQSAREKVLDAQSPSTRTPPSDIERYRAYVGEHCPGEDRSDLWMADWMFVNRPDPPKR